jgi:hypothetical protein
MEGDMRAVKIWFALVTLAPMAAVAGPTPKAPPAAVKPLLMKDFSFTPSAKSQVVMEGSLIKVTGEGQVTAELNPPGGRTAAKSLELTVRLTAPQSFQLVTNELSYVEDVMNPVLKLTPTFPDSEAFDLTVSKDGKVVEQLSNQKGTVAIGDDKLGYFIPDRVGKATPFSHTVKIDSVATVPAHWARRITLTSGHWVIVATQVLAQKTISAMPYIARLAFKSSGEFAVGVTNMTSDPLATKPAAVQPGIRK